MKPAPWTVLLGKLKRIGWTEMQPDGSIRLNCDSPGEKPTGDMTVATARMDGNSVLVDIPHEGQYQAADIASFVRWWRELVTDGFNGMDWDDHPKVRAV